MTLFRARLFLLALLLTASGFAQSDTPPSPSGQASSDSTQNPTAQQDKAGQGPRLVVTHFVQPEYPPEARSQKLQGQVVIHLVISTLGDVISAEPASGNPILAKAAAAAMLQWKFQPYIHNGQAVQIGYKMPYNFAIGDRVFDRPDPDAKPTSQEATAPTTASDTAAVVKPIKVSQGVSQALLLHQVVPVYPDLARQRGLQGTVALRAIIGTDGRVRDVHPVSGPTVFYEAAIGAVQQWRYKPYEFQGKPVEVETTINVNFRIGN